VIPEYLGGTNKRTFKDDLKDEADNLNKLQWLTTFLFKALYFFT
jgi:hypothetical protein